MAKIIVKHPTPISSVPHVTILEKVTFKRALWHVLNIAEEVNAEVKIYFRNGGWKEFTAVLIYSVHEKIHVAIYDYIPSNSALILRKVVIVPALLYYNLTSHF